MAQSLCCASDRCAVLRIAVLGIAVPCLATEGCARLRSDWAGSGVPCWLVGRRWADFPARGWGRGSLVSIPRLHQPCLQLRSDPPTGRKLRQPAAKRCARDLRTGRDATPSSRTVGRLLSQLKESAVQRTGDLVGEHFKLSQELRREAQHSGETHAREGYGRSSTAGPGGLKGTAKHSTAEMALLR